MSTVSTQTVLSEPPVALRRSTPAHRRAKPSRRERIRHIPGVVMLVALFGLAGLVVVHDVSTKTVPPSATATPPKATPVTPPKLPASSFVPSTGPATPPPGGPWVLSFDDEFNGTSLDPSKWTVCYPWNCTNSGNKNELEWYQAQNVTESGGTLQITAKVQTAHGMPFTSGLIQTDKKFTFRYGYMEIRVRLPQGQGLWPAFWALPTNETFPPEIDAFEYYGANPTAAMLGVHYGKNLHSANVIGDAALTEGYHTFAVDWEPGSLTWYVDGVKKFQTDVNVTQTMYLIANLAVRGPLRVDAKTSMPATMSIDWIRVWQHPLPTKSVPPGTAPWPK